MQWSALYLDLGIRSGFFSFNLHYAFDFAKPMVTCNAVHSTESQGRCLTLVLPTSLKKARIGLERSRTSEKINFVDLCDHVHSCRVARSMYHSMLIVFIIFACTTYIGLRHCRKACFLPHASRAPRKATTKTTFCFVMAAMLHIVKTALVLPRLVHCCLFEDLLSLLSCHSGPQRDCDFGCGS